RKERRGPAPKLRESDVMRAFDMLMEGETFREIARVLGTNPHVIRQYFPRVEPAHRHQTMTPEKWKECEGLLDEGYPKNEVARITGFSPATITKWFPGRGLSKREAGMVSFNTKRLDRIGRELVR